MKLSRHGQSAFFCFFVSAFILASNIYSETDTKNNSENEKFAEAEKLLTDFRTRQKALSILASLAKKNKDNNEKYEAKALLSKSLREEKKFDKAIEVVSDCTDFVKVSKNSTFQYKSSYLMAFLEAAHCKAFDKGKPAVRESFRMLDYSENNTETIDKARSQYKYGAVLFDMGEFSKADIYFRKAIETANDYLKDKKDKTSAGDSKQMTGTNAWQKLKPQIDELLFLVSIELLKAEYGEGYGLYVKAKTLFDEKSYESAMVSCRDLMVKHPGTIYDHAVRLTYSNCLSDSGNVKEAQKELEDFIKSAPASPYCGEAVMWLGKKALEKEWDIDKASRFYKQALAWFRSERERKDVTDLYSVPEKVVSVSAPQGPASSLDEWYRTVYRKQSPKEIINSRTAPWYADEMEKECLFMVGFFLFFEGDYDKAKECFSQVKSLKAWTGIFRCLMQNAYPMQY